MRSNLRSSEMYHPTRGSEAYIITRNAGHLIPAGKLSCNCLECSRPEFAYGDWHSDGMGILSAKVVRRSPSECCSAICKMQTLPSAPRNFLPSRLWNVVVGMQTVPNRCQCPGIGRAQGEQMGILKTGVKCVRTAWVLLKEGAGGGTWRNSHVPCLGYRVTKVAIAAGSTP